MRKYRRRVASSTQKPSLPLLTPVTLTTHKLLSEMTPDEGRIWIEGVHERLIAKQRRERAYLDRRAARKTHTPTDDAYEDDQQLVRVQETSCVRMEKSMRMRGGYPKKLL